MSVQYSLELAAFLFCAVVVLTVVANRAGFPYPILLVLAGVGLGLTPGFPQLSIDPDVVFLACLPPLLYAAAVRMPWHEFRASLIPIGSLAVGLVLATTLAVGGVVWALVPGIPFAAAATLGAIVAPTDAVSAVALARRLGIPERVVTILEGESLVNDASALVSYQFAVLAVISHTFTWAGMSITFLLEVGGGLLVGLAAGWLVSRVMRLLDDTAARITFLLVVPFVIFLVAEQFDLSGVLAVVAAGLYHGRDRTEFESANARMESNSVFSMVEYLLVGILFLLIGMQVHHTLTGLSGWDNTELLGLSFAVAGVVLGVRLLWAYPLARLMNRIAPRFMRDSERPLLNWRHQILVGWAGFRGVVSLAAALAVPLYTHAGHPFPERGLIIFLAASVVLITLVANGLTLPLIARALATSDDSEEERTEIEIRETLLRSMIESFDRRLEEKRLPAPAEEMMWVRAALDERLRLMRERAGQESDRAAVEQALRLQLELISVERAELRRLFHARRIPPALHTRLLREIDLDESRTRSMVGESARR